MLFEIIERVHHRRLAQIQLLDRHVLRLVIRQAQVVIGTQPPRGDELRAYAAVRSRTVWPHGGRLCPGGVT